MIHKKAPPWIGQYNILLESLCLFHGANLALNSDVDQDTFGKVTKHNSQEVSPFPAGDHKATRNRHNNNDQQKRSTRRSNTPERSVKKPH